MEKQGAEVPLRDAAGFQIGFQQSLVTHGGAFRNLFLSLPEVDAPGAELALQLLH